MDDFLTSVFSENYQMIPTSSVNFKTGTALSQISYGCGISQMVPGVAFK